MSWRALIQDAKNRGRLFTQEHHNISIDGSLLFSSPSLFFNVNFFLAKIAVQLAISAVEKPTTTKRRPLFEDAPWQVILSNRAVSCSSFVSVFFFFLTQASVMP